MSWGLVLTGVLSVTLLALGFNMVTPLGPGLDTICNLAGVASGTMFIGLAEGA